jgi:hypothetical protein
MGRKLLRKQARRMSTRFAGRCTARVKAPSGFEEVMNTNHHSKPVMIGKIDALGDSSHLAVD